MSAGRWCERCGAEAPGPWGPLEAIPTSAGARLQLAGQALRTGELVHVALATGGWLAGRLELADVQSGKGPPLLRAEVPGGARAVLRIKGPARLRRAGLCSCAPEPEAGGEPLRERRGPGARFLLEGRPLRQGARVEALAGGAWVAGAFDDPGAPASPLLWVAIAGIESPCGLHLPPTARLRRMAAPRALA